MITYEEKKRALYKQMEAYVKQDVCIAFSGGVDSSLLLKIAKECGNKVNPEGKIYGVTFDTTLHPSCDLEIAEKVAKEAGVIHKVISVNELEQGEIRFNPVNRCYLCKKALFQRLIEYAGSVRVSLVLEGTNEEDLHVYRPGLKAIRELGIISPLADAGFTKEEVRRLAGELGISVAKRPSTPCLATRLPYGTEIRPEILERVARGEEFLKNSGFPVVRIRLHGNIVRIEIPKTDFGRFMKNAEAMTAELKKMGFSYVTLDLEGFRSGSMDELLQKTF